MKMTKKGAIPAVKEDVWIGKCDYCNSEYTASRDELMREDSGVDARRNSYILNAPSRYSICELCGHKVYFDRMVTRGQHDSPWKVVPGSEFAR